jgi:hypothetical protein
MQVDVVILRYVLAFLSGEQFDFFRLSIGNCGMNSAIFRIQNTVMDSPMLSRDLKRLLARVAAAKSAFREGRVTEAYQQWKSLAEDYLPLKKRRAYDPKNDRLDHGLIALNESVCRRLLDPEGESRRIARYRNRKEALARRGIFPNVAIFSSITANYDSVKIPEKLDPRFDYVLFSDRPVSGGGVWDVRPLTYREKDAGRTSRYVKMHPHVLLPDYETAIWIDANIMILGDLKPMLDRFLASPDPIGAIPHPMRRNIYEELEACILQKKDKPTIMRKQIARYRKEGFHHDDLIEANFLTFKLRDSRTQDFLDRWWLEMQNGSKRDQLAINYALSAASASWHRLMHPPFSARNHPHLALVHHDHGRGPARKLISMGLPARGSKMIFSQDRTIAQATS